MEPIVVHVEPLKPSDFWWNQVYWWYRGVWRRFLAFLLPFSVIVFCLAYFQDKHGFLVSLAISLLSATAGLLVMYLIDVICFVFLNFLISKKHRKLREKSYSITFSEDGVSTVLDSTEVKSLYDHYERFFFYKRHLILQPVGVRNYYTIMRWSDVPQDRVNDLKELLKRKITKE